MAATATHRSRTWVNLASFTAAAAMLSLTTVSAEASPVPAGQIRIDGLRNRFSVPGGGYAGEFLVNASQLNFTPGGLGANGADHNHFISFCVETTEYLKLNTWYDAQLNTESLDTHLPLQSETAYLYSQFINGTLSGYKFSDSAATDTQKALSARGLQELIWYYQDPAGFAARYGTNAFDAGGYFMVGSTLNKVLARAWHTNLESWIASPSDTRDMSKVRIINIWAADGSRQDTIATVPLPASLWLGGMGLGAVGIISSRRRMTHSGSLPD